MAVFDIHSINYVIGGKTEKIINVDFVDDTKDKTEHLNKSFITDESIENDFDISASYKTHRLYHYVGDEGDKTVIYHDLFDFKDVAVKSDFYKADKTAVFGPKLSSDPLGFVQGINGNAYGASDDEKEYPIIAYTNLPDTRNDRLLGNTNSIVWQYKLDTPGDLLHTYAELDDKRLELLSTTISTEFGISNIYESPKSYYGYLSSIARLSIDISKGIETILDPAYNNTGLDRNFLYQIFVSNKKASYDKWNEFNAGNIFGNVFISKNFYDSKYSTALSAASSGTADDRVFQARKYIKLGATGGWPFLTYYDNRDWKSNQFERDKETTDLQTRQGERSLNNNGRKYQHVETIRSINRFINRGNHKSNLYSIRLNLNLSKDPKMQDLMNTVRLDIKNSIRRISSKLAPAHTQLFKVYIDGE